jgi:membrane protein
MFGGTIGKLKQFQADLSSAFRGEIPSLDQAKTPRGRLQRIANFWGLVGQSFWRNRCQVRASALAYTTLLALVPLLAVSLSVASLVFDTQSPDSKDRLAGYIEGFVENVAPMLGLVDAAEVEVLGPELEGDLAEAGVEKAAEQRMEVAASILDFTNQIHFGTIGVTAMIGLIFVAISLLRTIEAAFNDIWGVHRGRGWFESIVLYWAAITLGPIIFLVAMTSGYLNVLSGSGEDLAKIPGMKLLQNQFLPIVFLSFAFALFYKIIPNTFVQWQPALIGALVAAVLWWTNNRLGALYNTKVVTYSKIYGSLGAIPLFLIGLYLSWLILLFGAQVAYVFQNRQSYLQERISERIHQQAREFVALRLMTEICHRFATAAKPPSVVELSTKLGVPSRLTATVLSSLEDALLVVETNGAEDPGYLPARPIQQMTVQQVIHAIRKGQGTDLVTASDPLRATVQAEFAAVQAAEASRSTKVTMAELIQEKKEA